MKNEFFPDHDIMIDLLKDFSDNIDKCNNRHITIAKKYDVSNILSDDTIAKLQLTVGDAVVIPTDKLKEMFDEYKR